MQAIRKRFNSNLKRVLSLVHLYRMLIRLRVGWEKKDGPAVVHGDLLRAAVVLLHAALEDLLRSIEERLLPEAGEAELNEILIPLVGGRKGQRREKIQLGELSRYRGQTVDEVIQQAIEEHLRTQTYNNIEDIVRCLKRVGLRVEWQAEQKTLLRGMMQRRHLIAHRADRDHQRGARHHPLRSLEPEAVERWHGALDGFGAAVLSALDERG